MKEKNMNDISENRRCVIAAGSDIGDYENVKKHLEKDDYYIFCDSGLRHADILGVHPDLIVGDFDSYELEKAEGRGSETIVLPCEKDDTDSFFAAKEAIRRGFKRVLLIGALGRRFDHSMANISILIMLFRAGIKAEILDDHSVMEIVGENGAEIDGTYKYFSLLSVSGEAEGVDISGAKYPLSNAVISPEYQYGVSNEVLSGEKASVRVREGELLLIKVFGD